MYNELIESLKIPRLGRDVDGNQVEVARSQIWLADGFEINLFAMTDQIANDLYKIVTTAGRNGRWIGEEIWSLVEEDLERFYSGARTAEDTARIIQNRFQTYLSERQLIEQ